MHERDQAALGTGVGLRENVQAPEPALRINALEQPNAIPRALSYALLATAFEPLVPKRSGNPSTGPRTFECVRLPDGRIGRVRGRRGALVKVRVRRAMSNAHQFLMCPLEELKRVPCPKGWMSPQGYGRYLRVTLRKMRERERHGRRPR